MATMHDAPDQSFIELLARGAAETLMRPLVRDFVDTYQAACAHWLTTHRRLPGSDRTMRLVKKRYDRVMRAYRARYIYSQPRPRRAEVC